MMENKRFSVYNKSSEDMNEVASNSMDLVITDPPFNAGCTFGDVVDDAPHEVYVEKMRRVTNEISRVLTPTGIAIFQLPTVVRRNGKVHEYPQVYSQLCVAAGLQLIDSYAYVVHEDGEECLPEDVLRSYATGALGHSEELVGLVFSKTNRAVRIFPKGRDFSYGFRDGHPCPFPISFVADILDTYFNPGDHVLDTFMGTGALGEEVLRRGGTFTGYETFNGFYETAKKGLLEVIEK
jgi:DNA modification methylase